MAQEPSSHHPIEADGLSARHDVQAAQNISRIPIIRLEISSIFLYLAYMQYKVPEESRSCSAALLYRSQLAAVLWKLTAVLLEADGLTLTACQTVMTAVLFEADGLSNRHDGRPVRADGLSAKPRKVFLEIPLFF